MTRSRNNKNEKRTLRKKSKKDNKSKRRKRTVAKNKRRKKTQKKKKVNLQIGGNVEPIMARLLHTLERDTIEYLPSTKVVDSLQSEKHYVEMVDYIKLQEIINSNENFKQSPKIRKLFDYDLYEINEKDMYFVYKDFKCENIFKDVDKYYIYILYFYLMECNITRNHKIQHDGGGEEDKKNIDEMTSDPGDMPSDPEDILSDPIAEIEEPIPETPNEEKPEEEKPEEEKPEEEKPKEEKPEEEKPEEEKPKEEKPEEENPEEKPAEEKLEEEKPVEEKPVEEKPVEEKDILENEKREMDEQKEVIEEPIEENVDEKDNDENMEEKIELVNDIELPGFEEYEETRKKLDMKSDLVDGNIKITNSDLIKYKIDWFKVCMGIDVFDTGFENKVNTKLEELGIKPFKRLKYLEKIDIILDDKDLTSNFKNAIYERLMDNCKEPEDFINN